MKSPQNLPSCRKVCRPMRVVMSLIATLLLASQAVPAASFEWDTLGGGTGGGSGTWDTLNLNWYDTVAGSNLSWSATGTNDEAIFNWTSGTVDLAGGTVSANRLTFLLDGYTLTNGTVFLGGSAPTVYAEAGVNAAVNVGITGAVGVVYSGGGGVVTLTGPLQYAGFSTFNSNVNVILSGVLLPTNGIALQGRGGAGFLNLGGGTQYVPRVTFDTNFNLTITNGSLLVAGGFGWAQTTAPTLNASPRSVFDLSGLSNFSFDRASATFEVSSSGAVAPLTNELYLANAGGSNFIRVMNLNIGNAGVNQHKHNLHLGASNFLTAAHVRVGGYNSSGLIDFQSGITNGTLVLRGVGGGRVSLVSIVPNNGGSIQTGTIDLTGGSLDLLASNIVVGAEVNSGTTGTLIMPKGTLDAFNVTLANRTVNNGNTISGILTQGGGLVKASNLVLGLQTSTCTNTPVNANYNLNGTGTLVAASITAGGVLTNGLGAGYPATNSVRSLNFNGGTLTHYSATTDLNIYGTDPTNNFVKIVLGTATNHIFQVDAGRQITIGSNVVVSGTGNLVKSGLGTLNLGGSYTFTGGMRLNAGTTVMASGSLIAAFNAVTFGGTNSATWDLGGNSQTNSNVILAGAGGYTAVITNGALALVGTADLNLTCAPNSNTITMLLMNGLSSFSYNSPAKLVQVAGGGNYSNLLDWTLSPVFNSITASQIAFTAGGNGTYPFNRGIMRLGETNIFNLGSGSGTAIQMGGYRNGGNIITFQPGLVNPGVSIHASNGVSRAGDIGVAMASSGLGPLTGSFELGMADALVGSVVLGDSVQLGAGVTSDGFLSLTGGSLDATNIVLGRLLFGTNTTANNNGTLIGTLVQGGGTVQTPLLTFGEVVGTGIVSIATPGVFKPTYALQNGTLKAGVINANPSGWPTGAGSVRKLDWNAGTIQNLDASTDLAISGSTNAGGKLNLNLLASGPHTFYADTNRVISLAATVSLTGAATNGLLVKDGPGTLLLNNSNSFSGATVVSAGVLGGSGFLAGSVTVLGGASLAPGNSVGTLTVGGALSLSNGAVYAWEAGDLTTAASAGFGGAWTLDVSGSPTNGTYTLISTVSGVSGFVAPTITGASGTVGVSGNNVILTVGAAPVLTPFETWQTNYFGTTSNPAAALGADPDNDGANNLLEYAFGSVPTSAGSLFMPESGTSGNFLTITVPRNSNATDISYLVQGSTNLDSWATLSTLSATSPAPAGSTVTYTNATGFSAFPAQFLRVKVTQP